MPPAARSFTARDIALLVMCIVLSLIAQGLPERVREPISTGLRRSVISPLVALQHNAELTRGAWESRHERVLTRDSIVLRALAMAPLERENQHLRRLLSLGQQLKWGFVPADVVHTREVGEPYTVMLSAGSLAGIVPESPIVSPDGLVGMIRKVDPSMSVGISWAHPDFRVSAMAADGSTFGIVASHGGAQPQSYLLELRGIPFRSALKPGTAIVSSGLGIIPAGIPVGTVLSELKTSDASARTYLIRPAVMPADVSTVMILKLDRAAAGVSGAWATGQGLDTATKRIVAAGDSLARQAAAQAAAQAARLAPRDSLARDTMPRRPGAPVPEAGARRDSPGAAKP